MKLQTLPTHRRPREKIITQGIDALSDSELIAAMIGSGYQGTSALQIAESLLHVMPLEQLAGKTIADLLKIKGIGRASACRLLAAVKIGALMATKQAAAQVTKPAHVASMMGHLTKYAQEHVVCLYLNARQQLISQSTISIGTVSSALIHPREVYAPALHARASSVILVHNHPSQDPQPSEEDIVITHKLVEVGDVMDIPLIDHVIVTSQGWSSLRQLNLL